VTSRGLPASDLLALMKHHDPARQRHDDFTDVLDDHERDAGAMDVAHQIDRELDLLLGSARPWLRRASNTFGSVRERTGNFQPLAAGRAEASAPAHRQPAHADALQHRAGFCFGDGAMRGAQRTRPIITFSSTVMPSKVCGT